MTDLHTHILPGLDDGSRNIETTTELLQMEAENGVDNVVFTPHFLADEETVTDFIKRRKKANDQIKTPLKTKLSAEVYYTDNLNTLTDKDLKRLCLEGTNYFFLEFSQNPEKLEDAFPFIDRLIEQDIVPILVHIERYKITEKQLKELNEKGCLCQVNCSSLLGDKKLKKYILKLIKKNYVQLLATDTHSVLKRPVNMQDALKQVPNPQQLIDNADKVFNGEKVKA